MPMRMMQRRVMGSGKSYLLCDRFDVALAAGSVNGTSSTPGPGTRSVVDVDAILSLTGGVVAVADTASPAFGDLSFVINKPVARAAGRMLFCKVRRTNSTSQPYVLWSNTLTPSLGSDASLGHFILLNGTATTIRDGGMGISSLVVGENTTNGWYTVALILRAVGCFYYIKGGTEFPTWTLLYFAAADSDATLYAALVNYDQTSEFNDLLVPAIKWLPAPIASDSFTRGNGALGTTDGAGHAEANGGSGLTWQFDAGVWTIATNKAVGTPTQGADQVTNGNMETGDPPTGWDATNVTPDGVADERTGGAGAQSLSTIATAIGEVFAKRTFGISIGVWHRLQGYGKWVIGTGNAHLRWRDDVVGQTAIQTINAGATWTFLVGTGRSTQNLYSLRTEISSAAVNDEARFDDVSLVALTLSSLFSAVAVSTANVKVRATVAALTSRTQAGITIINNAATPTQGIIAYFDGAGSVKIDEFTAATTWNALATAAKAFTANDALELDISGTAWRCYHVTAAGVPMLIGSGTFTANLGSTPYAGMFSTYSGNTFAACTVWAKGNEGQYAALDALGA